MCAGIYLQSVLDCSYTLSFFYRPVSLSLFLFPSRYNCKESEDQRMRTTNPRGHAESPPPICFFPYCYSLIWRRKKTKKRNIMLCSICSVTETTPCQVVITSFPFYIIQGGFSSSLSSLSAKNDFYLSATAAERASRS